jgi:hypothetical protein
MIMEKRSPPYYMRSLQKHYVIYIALISIYISKNIENIEHLHISSQYEVVESDTTLEYAQLIVDKLIAETVEKMSDKHTMVPSTPPIAASKSIWGHIKTYNPLNYLF